MERGFERMDGWVGGKISRRNPSSDEGTETGRPKRLSRGLLLLFDDVVVPRIPIGRFWSGLCSRLYSIGTVGDSTWGAARPWEGTSSIFGIVGRQFLSNHMLDNAP